jgi:thioredoxin 1
VDAVREATFADEVLASPIPVVVDFWAPRCKPCDAIEPHLLGLADEWAGRVRFVRVDVDAEPVLGARYGVLSLPTVVLFAAGEPKETIYGAQPRSVFERKLGAFVEDDRATVVPVETAQATDVAVRFLDALSRRDFGAVGGTFSEDARLRGLMPSVVRECQGTAAIEERFRIWSGDLEEFALLDSEIAPMADVTRIQWRVRGIDPEDGLTVYEQTAYAGIEGDRIAWMNLVCSGQRPIET